MNIITKRNKKEVYVFGFVFLVLFLYKKKEIILNLMIIAYIIKGILAPLIIILLYSNSKAL